MMEAADDTLGEIVYCLEYLLVLGSLFQEEVQRDRDNKEMQ